MILDRRFLPDYSGSSFDFTIYIHPNGDDTNPGTEDSPLQTIEAAIDRFINYPGSSAKIKLYPGTYIFPQKFWILIESIVYIQSISDGVTLQLTSFVDSVFSFTNSVSGFTLESSCIRFEKVTIQLPDKADVNLVWADAFKSLVRTGHPSLSIAEFYSCDIIHGSDGSNLATTGIGNWNGHLALFIVNCNITTHSVSSVYDIQTSSGGGTLYVDTSTTIDNSAYWVSGVVKDTNDVPTNLVTNLII